MFSIYSKKINAIANNSSLLNYPRQDRELTNYVFFAIFRFPPDGRFGACFLSAVIYNTWLL